jgi:hypothetical protein
MSNEINKVDYNKGVADCLSYCIYLIKEVGEVFDDMSNYSPLYINVPLDIIISCAQEKLTSIPNNTVSYLLGWNKCLVVLSTIFLQNDVTFNNELGYYTSELRPDELNALLYPSYIK